MALDADEARRRVAEARGWHQLFELQPGVFSPGAYSPVGMLAMLQLPDDLSGMRVLDVGACDGYFSREMDRRGAEVVALDYRSKELSGFGVMEACYGRPIQHFTASLYDIPQLELGTFDIVLLLGVIYHLPDPLGALRIMRGVCRGKIIIESYTEHFGDAPAARYYPADTLAGDGTNFFAPNPLCLQAWMQDAGFECTRLLPYGDRCLAEGRVSPEGGKLHQPYALVPVG